MNQGGSLFRLEREDDEASARINISPLVDMVFLLLIFFMVTSVFTRTGNVAVSLPEAASAPVAEESAIFLTLTSEGEILWQDRVLALSEVRGWVESLLQERPARPVTILAHRDAPTGSTVRLLEECRLAGARTLSLGAQRENAPEF